ncbi:uncharacterized protein LOC135820786 [Sycon ciliatum]|uniref:uncharacterized protein LOC135820786 n=1 Tax=Sycon ciliatum TaxID=27933 RepID=UPI0031F67080
MLRSLLLPSRSPSIGFCLTSKRPFSKQQVGCATDASKTDLCRLSCARPWSSTSTAAFPSHRRINTTAAAMSQKYELFVKAGKDGHSMGDCPFCQFSMIVFAHKKVAIDLVFIDLANKPASFLEMAGEFGGSVPVLKHGDTIIPDSSKIAEYVQKLHPEPNMECDRSAEVNDTTKGVFSAFAGLMKNKDVSVREELEQRLVKELELVDSWLGSNPGKFLCCGDTLTLPDCSLGPKLLHIRVAGQHYRNFVIPDRLANLHKYMEALFGTSAFKESACTDSEIIHGWSRFA